MTKKSLAVGRGFVKLHTAAEPPSWWNDMFYWLKGPSCLYITVSTHSE